MKKASFLFLIFPLATLLMSMSGCKKSATCKAGSGGDVTLHIELQHHGFPIYSSTNYRDTVRIKFSAADFPGVSPSNYDIIQAGNASENFVNITGLKCGQYYLYTTGFDTSATWNIRVVGGLPLNFSETTGTKTVVMPVSE